MTQTVSELWRYPVKSMMGESLPALEFAASGAAGDRAWAPRDEVSGGLRVGKKVPELMRCSARYPGPPPAPGRARPAEILLPDGQRLMTTDTDVNRRLSGALGHAVSLWPLLPADALDPYGRDAADNSDPGASLQEELRATFGRTEDEPLPDISAFPPELLESERPPATYFDALPVLILAASSLQRLARVAPEVNFDVRRFRPNIVIDTLQDPALHTELGTAVPPNDFIERSWVGRTLRIGEVEFTCEVSCPRCVMTTHGFDDLPADPAVMRQLVQQNQGDLGVYAQVTRPGRIAIGDTLTVL